MVEEQVLREGSQEGAEQESDFSGEEREKCLHYISKGRPDATENLYQYPGLSSLFLLGT